MINTTSLYGPSFAYGLTWYAAVEGINHNDDYTQLYLSPAFASRNIIPNSSRSGILSWSLIYNFDSLGNFVDKVVYGGKFSQVTDGLSNTVMIGERPPSPDLDYGRWVSGGYDVRAASAPTTLRYLTSDGSGVTGTACQSPAYFGPGDNTNYCSFNHFWSWHTVGGNFAFGDGSVRFLSYSANQILIPLSTRAGGEVVNASQY